MNNILIVDHTSDIRLQIKSLIVEYAEKHNLEFNIEEAENAQEAVELTSQQNFDIIFIDVNMSVGDGVKVIQAIKERCNATMIIAVADINDDKRLKEVLNRGADDYVLTPINHSIYFHRLTSYLALVKAKRHKLKNEQKINVYTKNIFSRVTKFIINSENALAEFWEYFLSNSEDKYYYLHDIVRTMFSISEVQYTVNKYSEIYLEESSEYMYFSILNVSNIPVDKLNAYVKNCPRTVVEYKIENDTLTVCLKKVFTLAENQTLKPEEKISTQKLENVQKQDDSSAKEPTYQSSKRELKVFDYMEDEDLHDLYDYSSSLNSLMLLAGSGDLEVEDVYDMAAYLEKIAGLLSTYSEIYVISTSLNALASVMQTHTDVFKEKSEMLGPLCKGFVNDMSSWIRMSFETGAPSEDFMNDTIAVNCQTISSILTMDDAAEDNQDNLDDIFDF